MKTIHKSMMAIIVVFATFMLPNTVFGQACSITLDNSTNFNLTVTVEWFDNSGPGCTTVCDSQTGIAVPSASSTPVTCSGCAGVCNFRVTVTAPALGPMPVDINTQSNSGTGCTISYEAQ